MPKYALRNSAWVFSCEFAAYFQNTFSQEQLWAAACYKRVFVFLDHLPSTPMLSPRPSTPKYYKGKFMNKAC